MPPMAMGEPADIANMMLYLSSNESKFVTGANMVIDNGTSIA